MAFSTILLRRGRSLAVGAIGVSRNYYCYSAPATKTKFLSPTTNNFLLHNNFSSGATVAVTNNNKDQNLVRVIQSEIECSLQSDDHNRVEEAPNGFPFKIEDIPGQETITLKREYNGEDIKVEVHMPNLVTGEEDDDGDEDDDDGEKSNQASIPLVVTVSKRSGPCLEFGVTAFPDEVAIDSMSVKEQDSSEDRIPYEGPDFTSLDENLQKTFHKYLEIRGIKPITTNYLYEYMINKDSREYLLWLNNLKKFVEN